MARPSSPQKNTCPTTPAAIAWQLGRELFNGLLSYFDCDVCWQGGKITTENLDKVAFELNAVIRAIKATKKQAEEQEKKWAEIVDEAEMKGAKAGTPLHKLNSDRIKGLLQELRSNSNSGATMRLNGSNGEIVAAPLTVGDAKLKKNLWGRKLVTLKKGSLALKKRHLITKNANETSKRLKAASTQLLDFREAVKIVHVPGTATRKATLPFPPTQLLDNYGAHELGHVAKQVYDAFKIDVVNRDVAHAADVAAFLREELAAAYALMGTERMRGWWAGEASSGGHLARLVREGRIVEIKQQRAAFMASLPKESQHSCAGSLAWCVFVESVLLNERLIRDMRETAGNRGCGCAVEGWLPFFGPNPPAEARALFSEYVRCRWPIHVFTLDPVVNEQNIQKASSIYREMQLAVALSFASGQMGSQAAMQAMRRLQRDTATIDLNRTIVGFAHGPDTFGWRFYPRFQTPPVEGNLTVFFRDTLLGGPTDEALLQTQRLEPGVRECLALVVMPSFVPYVRFDTRGNWFNLRHPEHTAVSMADTVEFSRSIRAMRVAARQGARCAHLYRDGTVARLLKRVQQLERELPLQTMDAQVPYENSLGGFELFSSGTSQLAPELLGWYGAPGIDPRAPTHLFLAGDGFSVHHTRLIVGNQAVPFRLLSRQIMEVTLPAGLRFLDDPDLAHNARYRGYVDAHLATPYGVSSHLLIPVLREPESSVAVSPIRLAPARFVMNFTYDKEATRDKNAITFIEPQPTFLALRFDVPPGVGFGEYLTKVEFFPRDGDIRLRSISLDGGGDAGVGVRVDASGYVIGGDKFATFIEKEGEKNDLSDSITHYLEYLVDNGQFTTGSKNLTVTATVTQNNIALPVEGQIAIQVVVSPKPKSEPDPPAQ